MIKEELTYIIGIIAPTSSKKYYYLKNKFEVHLQLSGLGVRTARKNRMGETTITTDITARPGFEHELPELYALPISQAGI